MSAHWGVVIEFAPLEDELGDVLEKGMRLLDLTETELAERAQVSVEKLRDAIDYRYDLSEDELRRLASALQLKEAGLLTLASGHYPHADIGGLPLCLYPLRMAHGIGVANAYIVADCCQSSGMLFDAGVDYGSLNRVWPKRMRKLEAVFITHAESEHTGGLERIFAEFGPVPVFGPATVQIPGVPVVTLADGVNVRFGRFQVTVLSTPGHAEEHCCYVVTDPALKTSAGLLVSGDLLFAGSIGGAHYCRDRLRLHVRRLFETLPEQTVVAPGHGPLTTLGIERKCNPFA